MKLPLEYVALLAFYATDVGKERRSKARQILLRVIQLRREYMVMNSSMRNFDIYLWGGGYCYDVLFC